MAEALPLYERATALAEGQRDAALLNSYGAALCKFPERYGEAKLWFEVTMHLRALIFDLVSPYVPYGRRL